MPQQGNKCSVTVAVCGRDVLEIDIDPAVSVCSHVCNQIFNQSLLCCRAIQQTACAFSGKGAVRRERGEHHKRNCPKFPRGFGKIAVINDGKSAIRLCAEGKDRKIGQIRERFAQDGEVNIGIGIAVDCECPLFRTLIFEDKLLPGENTVVASELRVVLPELIDRHTVFGGNRAEGVALLHGIHPFGEKNHKRLSGRQACRFVQAVVENNPLHGDVVRTGNRVYRVPWLYYMNYHLVPTFLSLFYAVGACPVHKRTGTLQMDAFQIGQNMIK